MKFYERLEYWSYLLRSKALYYELKYYVKKKQTHIKRLYHFNSRGIGKTYNLMKISGKYKIPVLFAAGKLAENYAKAAKAVNPDCEIYYFEDRQAMTEALTGFVKEGDSVLVKASHFMEFPKVVEALSK